MKLFSILPLFIISLLSFPNWNQLQDSSKTVQSFQQISKKTVLLSQQLHKPTHSIEDVYDLLYQTHNTLVESKNLNATLLIKIDTLTKTAIKSKGILVDQTKTIKDLRDASIAANIKADYYMGAQRQLDNLDLVINNGMYYLWIPIIILIIVLLVQLGRYEYHKLYYQ